MKWFRFYNEFRSDPKLSLMSPHHQWAFVILLCLASENSERGKIVGLNDEELAFQLRMPVEDWRTLKAKFKVKGMIDWAGDVIQIINWDNRQFYSDSSAERVAKHRQKKEEDRHKRNERNARRRASYKEKPSNESSQVEKLENVAGEGEGWCNVTSSLLKRHVTASDPDPDPDLLNQECNKRPPIVPQGGDVCGKLSIEDIPEIFSDQDNNACAKPEETTEQPTAKIENASSTNSLPLESSLVRIETENLPAAARGEIDFDLINPSLNKAERAKYCPEQFEEFWKRFKSGRDTCNPITGLGSKKKTRTEWDKLFVDNKKPIASDKQLELSGLIIQSVDPFWAHEAGKTESYGKNANTYLSQGVWKQYANEFALSTSGASVKRDYSEFFKTWDEVCPDRWANADRHDATPQTFAVLDRLIAEFGDEAVSVLDASVRFCARNQYYSTNTRFTFSKYVQDWKRLIEHYKIQAKEDANGTGNEILMSTAADQRKFDREAETRSKSSEREAQIQASHAQIFSELVKNQY